MSLPTLSFLRQNPQYGFKPDEIGSPQEVAGGLIVAGQTLDETEAKQYRGLKSHLDELSQVQGQKQAIETLIDEIAYTWFNRLAALRYLEVNGYIGRVLSSSDAGFVDPDILREASAIAETQALPGLDFATLEEWRSLASRAPNADEFLYRRLLMVQCEALSEGIPFLFDRSKFYMALFMPANLLNQDSIRRRLVKDIPEEDWQAIEIVGWLYQFYISERKDEVIGAKSKVSAQDIPAATQLFTPHWIVRYMVENSVGRLWLEGHPESRLREKMPYYLDARSSVEELEETEPAEGQLEILQPLIVSEVAIPMTPQELTVCDPACGSGHILVYAFDLLFEIYQEQGYRSREIPGLILAHNLVGLDIEDRAVQLASFAVLMKARQYDARILRKPPRLNIVTVRSTRNLRLPMAEELTPGDWQPLLGAFEDADNLGSLITPPGFDESKLTAQLDALEQSRPLLTVETQSLRGVILQAQLLRKQYWAVVANPPYMGSSSFNPTVKSFVEKNYASSKSDLYGVYVSRNLELCRLNGSIGMITIPNWMFLSSFKELRRSIVKNYYLKNLIHNGRGVFGSDFGSCSFIIEKRQNREEQGVFKRLFEKQGSVSSPEELEKKFHTSHNHYANPHNFSKLPSSQIAYWARDRMLTIFEKTTFIQKITISDSQNITGKNDKFVRLFWEINKYDIGTSNTWRFYAKGGGFRKWRGNLESVVNWSKEAVKHYREDKVCRLTSEHLWERSGITWGMITSAYPSFRWLPPYAMFDVGGSSIFFKNDSDLMLVLGFLNSKVAIQLLQIYNPTLNVQINDVRSLPWKIEDSGRKQLQLLLEKVEFISQVDWDNFETTYDFQTHPLLRSISTHQTSQAFTAWKTETEQAFQELKQLEEENNRCWIEAYGLQDELTPEVPEGMSIGLCQR